MGVNFTEKGPRKFKLTKRFLSLHSGKSWCPDCVTYGPVVDKVMAEVQDDSVAYIYCSVGGRDYWKNQTNEFRTDPNMKLSGVPTFMRWNNPAVKVVEDQINHELVKEMVEES